MGTHSVQGTLVVGILGLGIPHVGTALVGRNQGSPEGIVDFLESIHYCGGLHPVDIHVDLVHSPKSIRNIWISYNVHGSHG